jgi:ribosomal protein S18 acetylase RimI-like enzyme
MRVAAVESEGDLQVAAELFREYAAGLDFSLEYQGFEQEMAQLPGRYAPPRGCILLAWADGTAIGCVALREIKLGGEPGPLCEMKRLYVRPSARGLGAGRALCEELIARARSMGYVAMKLDTSEDMHAAKSVYTRLGFRPCERYNDDPMPDTLYFELRL